MSRYISISLLLFFGSILIVFLLANLIGDDDLTLSIGIIIVLLLSIIIILLVRIIELMKKIGKKF